MADINRNAIEEAIRRMGNTPISSQLKNAEAREKTADFRRSNSKTTLNINAVLGFGKKTAIEEALAEINSSQSPLYEQLTVENVKEFAKRVQRLQKEHGMSGGITPRGIINRSRKIDIQRAQSEIFAVAAVRQQKDGIIHFRTNASAQSRDTYHIVKVQFLDFPAALNSTAKITDLAKAVLRGAVKFDCDCGRHRFWYRYVATSGGFNLGKAETAYPKIRNPELTGLGCKHVLRVMHSLQSTIQFVPTMKQMLERYRQDPNAQAKTLGKKQAKIQAEQTAKAAMGGQIRKRFANAEKVKKQLKKIPKQENKWKMKNGLQAMLEAGVLSQKEFDALLKKIDT